MTNIIPRWTTADNQSEWYRTATVRLMDHDSKYGMRYTRCVAFSLIFWFSKFNMVTGITYLPAAAEWWKDNRRNTPENMLTAADSIYRIILLLMFAGSDLKLADLLGISIYGDDNYFIGGGRTHDRGSSQEKRPWFLEDWTEDL
jgi:hypothetical protein